ncbi:MAG TPA: nuclear transport factor 2 family protein [Pyrinomonadaceae bacterium]|nr:nuclear transport factor 2 family protein [Pyrinomonadaceae bacterium]
MKKILALVSLLVLAAACAPAPSSNKDMPTNANSNANKSADMKTSAAPSEADIIAKEKASWDAFRKKDADAFGKLLAADYVEVTDMGVSDKATALAGMKDFDISDVTFADWKMMTIDKDAVIITYTANIKGSYKGKAVPPGPYRETSAYVNRSGEWVAIYYQETKNMTGPPPPMPKEAPKAASPSGTPGQTSSDAAANEKLVWDAFKARNYDAFGSYLADNFVEVEADGVYDKAGSIKGVQGFDASKAELSNWKTVKFDDDASLVTYVAKIPGSPTAYHSSIWVNKNGKWVGLFHQGTPEEAPEKK